MTGRRSGSRPARPRGPAPAVSRPRMRDVGVVAAGGTVGALARVAIAARFPAEVDRFPWATFVENVTGAFLLALVLTLLGGRPAVRPEVRLALGTGALGAFTTYSTLAREVVERLSDGHVVLGTVYGLATVTVGVAAAVAGMWAGRLPRRTRRSGPR